MFDWICRSHTHTQGDQPVGDSDAVAAEEGTPEPTHKEVDQEIANCRKSIYYQVSGLPCCNGVRAELRQLELLHAELETLP